MEYRYANSYALIDILLLLLYAYVLKFSNISADIDFVLLAWLFVAAYTILAVSIDILIQVSVFYIILLVGYIVPYLINQDREVDLEYGRILVSSFILTSLFLGFVKGRLRNFRGLHQKIINSTILIYVLYIPVVLWIAFIFYQSEISHVNVVREYGGANYLTPSDLLAMATLLISSIDKIPKFGRLFFTVLTLFALILLGSRASIVIFIFTYVITLQSVRLPRKILIVVFLAMTLGIFYYIVSELDVDFLFRLNTMSDLAFDPSRIARQQLLVDYFHVLMNSPQCWFIACPPAPGDYAHNIISIQQYFGIIGTITVGVLVLLFIINTLKNKTIPLAALGLYVMVQTLFFRSWQSLTFPIFIGFLFYYPLLKKSE